MSSVYQVSTSMHKLHGGELAGAHASQVANSLKVLVDVIIVREYEVNLAVVGSAPNPDKSSAHRLRVHLGNGL